MVCSAYCLLRAAYLPRRIGEPIPMNDDGRKGHITPDRAIEPFSLVCRRDATCLNGLQTAL